MTKIRRKRSKRFKKNVCGGINRVVNGRFIIILESAESSVKYTTIVNRNSSKGDIRLTILNIFYEI